MVHSPFQTLAISLKGKDSKGLDVTESRGLTMVFTAKQRANINRSRVYESQEFKTDGYLVKKTGGVGSRAHIWRNGDTLCRMASTGGMNLRRYTVTDAPGREVCQLCENVDLGIHDKRRELEREYREIVG